MGATDRPKPRERPREDETEEEEEEESLHFGFRLEDSPWCRHAASWSSLLFDQCGPFANFKRKTEKPGAILCACAVHLIRGGTVCSAGAEWLPTPRTVPPRISCTAHAHPTCYLRTELQNSSAYF